MEATAIMALVGTVFGGVGLKVIEHLLARKKTKDDLAGALRKELREEVGRMRQELKEESQGHDAWREKYWTLYEKHVTLGAEMKAANRLLAQHGLPHTNDGLVALLAEEERNTSDNQQ
jgi:hypothetical protein